MFNVTEASQGLIYRSYRILYVKSCLLWLLVVALSQWLEVFSSERVKKTFQKSTGNKIEAREDCNQGVVKL